MTISVWVRELHDSGADYEMSAGTFYGIVWEALCRRAVTRVGEILKASKPVDLPMEQPMKFEQEINWKRRGRSA